MPNRPRALLLENIHLSSHVIFGSQNIEVQTQRGALAEDDLIEALNSMPGEGPLLVGIRSKTHITKRVLGAVPRLATIGCFCIGTDQVDLTEASQHGVAVFNAPFSSTRSVAELVMGEVIMLARSIFPRSNAAHAGRWAKSADGAHELRGKVLGIVGYGHIGSQVSILAEAFGMRVVYYDVVTKLPLGNSRSVESLDELLEQSDFVSLHVPDTDKTRGLMGLEELGKMKAGAHLLNLSRGKVVDLDALRELLLSGHLAGAAVDVYPSEPAKAGDAFESPLRGLDTVILTPHIGGSTFEAQQNIGKEVATACARFINEGQSVGCVSLPGVDPAPRGESASRIVNIHQNAPGALHRITEVLASQEINISGQMLATQENEGLLIIDLDVDPQQANVKKLCSAISRLDISLRTRLLPIQTNCLD